MRAGSCYIAVRSLTPPADCTKILGADFSPTSWWTAITIISAWGQDYSLTMSEIATKSWFCYRLVIRDIPERAKTQ